MGNILSILQEIFLGKENNSFKVGLSEYKKRETTLEQPLAKTSKRQKPKELRLSELMRHGSY